MFTHKINIKMKGSPITVLQFSWGGGGVGGGVGGREEEKERERMTFKDQVILLFLINCSAAVLTSK